jgi:hypothetical protein
VPPKPVKQRLVPYKVLGLLLYGRLDSVIERVPGRIRVASGSFARSCQIPNSRFWEAINWLIDMQILSKITKLEWGVVDIYYNDPAYTDLPIEEQLGEDS